MNSNKEFLKNYYLILNNFKINWKFIITISFFWFIFLCVTFALTLTFEGGPTITGIDGSIHNSNGSINSLQITSVNMIYDFCFKGVGLVFYSCVSLFLIHKTVFQEYHSSKFSIWMVQPITRRQLIFSKLSFILITISAMFLISFIFLMSFGGASFDSEEYLINLFLGSIQIYIFIIFIVSLFFCISILLVDKLYLSYLIILLIIFYFAFIEILKFIVLITQMESKAIDIWIQFIGFQALVVDLMKISQDQESTYFIINISDGKKIHIEMPVIIAIQNFRYWISNLFILFLNVSLWKCVDIIFRNKSLST